jgi:thioredoxin-disulfide reductase
MFDLIIIGAGPAGMTAGIYAARREMKALIIGRETGGQMIWASEIANFPGFKNIGSFDLIERMREQVTALGVEIKNDEVKRIEKNEDNGFTLTTEKEKLAAKTVIIAMGLSPRRLAIPGEEKFAGKGVSYCANCDGPLFRGKTVAVVGGGNAALDAAEVLGKIAAKVYLIHRREEFRAFAALADKVRAAENVELVLESEVKEIAGDKKVEKIIVHDNKSGSDREIKADGIFVEIGRIASTDLAADLAERNEWSQIIVDEKCHTKTEGLFAAGDVTTVPYKQITVACGQGTIAALAAYEYLQMKEGKAEGVVINHGH